MVVRKLVQMFSPAPIEVPKADSLTSIARGNCREGRDVRFSDLRGVQWRINLRILPSSAPTDELHRVSADAQRRKTMFFQFSSNCRVNMVATRESIQRLDLVSPTSSNAFTSCSVSQSVFFHSISNSLTEMYQQQALVPTGPPLPLRLQQMGDGFLNFGANSYDFELDPIWVTDATDIDF